VYLPFPTVVPMRAPFWVYPATPSICSA